MSDSNQVNLPAGTKVGGFRIEEYVGAGAMAVVYRAVQINLDRPVALKILPRDFSRSRDYVDRFFNEARAAAAFSHPNIVRAYDAGIDENDICYFAMEFVEGETVLDRIVREGVLPVIDGLQIALKIAEALEYGWQEHRLLHGDIKPANLMISSHGATKLADFGLAKVAEIEEVSGSTMLTPLYACPEVIQGFQPEDDCRPDIYSFGATLYHMLAGNPPFPGDDSKEVMRMQVEAPLTPLCEVNADIPGPVSDLVSLMLQKDPSKRAQSWAAVVEHLQEALGALSRSHMTAMVPASGSAHQTPARARSPGSAAGRRRVGQAGKRARSAGNTPGMLIAGSLLGLLVVGVVVLLLLVMHGGGNPVGTSDPAPPTTPPSSPGPESPELSARRRWEKMRRRLTNEPDLSRRIDILSRFEKASRGHPHVHEVREMLAISRKNLAEEIRRKKEEEARRREFEEALEGSPKDPEDEDSVPSEEEKQILATETANAYARLAYALTTYELSFVSGPQEAAKLALAWDRQFPQEDDYDARIQFLTETVLPAFADLKNVLINNQDFMAGVQIPGMEDRVQSFDSNGAATMVSLTGAGGKVERKLAWADFSSPTVVRAFAKKLLTKKNLTPGELHTALSCMVLDGAASAVEVVSKRLEPDQSRLWVLLARDVEAAPREVAALDQLSAAREAVDNGAFLSANGLLNDLESTPNTVKTRYEKEIALLREKVDPYTPRHRLKLLKDKARELVAIDPYQALALMITGLARYGGIDTSDVTELKALSTPIQHHLARQLVNGEKEVRWDFYQEFRPFMHNWQSRPGRPLAILELFTTRSDGEDLPPEVARYSEAFHGLSWVEAGNWQSGPKQFSNLAENRRADIPPRIRFAFTYADALIALRLNGYAGILDHRVTKMHALATNEEGGLSEMSLAIHFALAAERYRTAGDLVWPSLEDVHRDGHGLLGGYAAALLALRLTNADRVGAVGIVEQTAPGRGHDPDGEPAPDLHDRRRLAAWLRAKMMNIPEEFGDDEAEGIVRKPPLYLLSRNPASRWILHLLASRKMLTEKEKEWCGEILADHQLIVDQLDAKRTFEQLILTVTELAGGGGKREAAEAVDEFLAIRVPALVDYYPRALALKAGILMLQGQSRAAKETLSLVELSTVASAQEREWAAYDERPVSTRVSKIKPGDYNVPGLFMYWDAWLNCCYWLAHGNQAMAAKEAKMMHALTASDAKRSLALSVIEWQGTEMPER